MMEVIDYIFIYPEDDTTSVHIKILTGFYEGTVYKYNKVSFDEKDDKVYLVFSYDVIESAVEKPNMLEKDEKFKNFIGYLLIEIMDKNGEEDLTDETGTNYNQESDL